MRWCADQDQEVDRRWTRTRRRPASGWCSLSESYVVAPSPAAADGCHCQATPAAPWPGRLLRLRPSWAGRRHRQRMCGWTHDAVFWVCWESEQALRWVQAGQAAVRRNETRRYRWSCRRCSRLDQTRPSSWSASASLRHPRRIRLPPRMTPALQTAERCTRSTTEGRRSQLLVLVEDWTEDFFHIPSSSSSGLQFNFSFVEDILLASRVAETVTRHSLFCGLVEDCAVWRRTDSRRRRIGQRSAEGPSRRWLCARTTPLARCTVPVVARKQRTPQAASRSHRQGSLPSG